MNYYERFFKPFFDVIVSLFGMVIFMPLFLLVAFCLLISNKGNVFFTQERVGKNERIFKVFKFKTMTDETDHHNNLLSDEKRLTWIGKVIRSLSLDELPQLLNVVMLDMSLIGPRPLLVEYLPYYSAEQKRRHKIKPGITGWAQVNGRNLLNWDKRFEFDTWYVDHVSFLVDQKILFLTIRKVFLREGISPHDRVTMPTFIEYKKSKSNG